MLGTSEHSTKTVGFKQDEAFLDYMNCLLLK